MRTDSQSLIQVWMKCLDSSRAEKKYKSEGVKHNRRGGSDHVHCSYFTEMDGVLGKNQNRSVQKSVFHRISRNVYTYICKGLGTGPDRFTEGTVKGTGRFTHKSAQTL